MKKVLVGLILFIASTAFVGTDIDFVEILVKRLREYKSQNPHVKVFLFFNQNTFAPGDTAFFAARFMTEDFLPIRGRQILRVEIENDKGEVVFFEHIALKDGKGANQVIIPSELPAGRYQWISYSEYMRNFDPRFYFSCDFNLVSKGDLQNGKEEDLVLNFYPEGGTFIASIPNRIVLEANKDFVGDVSINDNTGIEITRLTVGKPGLISFVLTPEINKTYFAKVNDQGRNKEFNLPQSKPSGYSIMVSPDTDPMKVAVDASSDLINQQERLSLVVTSRSEIYYSAPFKFGDSELVNIQLPVKDLPRGIAYITLFDEKGNVLAERLINHHINPQVSIELIKSQSSYGNRSPISLDVVLKDELGNPVNGNFAISVVKENLFHDQSLDISIEDYLYLYSDISTRKSLKGFTPEQIDLFLMTQKNSKIDWPKILTGNTIAKHSFRAMVYYSGQALQSETGMPVPDSTRIITYLQKNMMGYETVTGKAGRFDLAFLFDFWNEDEIFYFLEGRRGGEINGEIKWDIDSPRQTSNSFQPEEDNKNRYAEYQMKKRLIDQSYNFYSSVEQNRDTENLVDPNDSFEDEVSGADISVNVQDYMIFPTMEELIREIIPYLQHRKVAGKSNVRVILSEGEKVPKQDPLFMIDGVMTKNTAYFLKLKPSEIISIKLVNDVNKLNRLGILGSNGIVLVYTKKRGHPELKKINSQLPVKGLSKPIAFRHPTHPESKQRRKPDFRSTLFWNPGVETDALGKATLTFNASDDVGTFLIRIKGMTTGGHPFERTDSLTISFSGN